MTNPLTTKMLAIGLTSLLGGAGLTLGPEVAAEMIGATDPASLPLAEAAQDADEAIDEGAGHGRSAAAHARRDASRNDRAEGHGRSAAAHARRDAFRAERAEARAARRAILADRPAPGEGPRGLSPEAREAMRELRPSRAASPDRARGRGAERGAPAHAHRPEAERTGRRGAPDHGSSSGRGPGAMARGGR